MSRESLTRKAVRSASAATAICRLLVNGAMSVLCSKRAKEDPWLVKLLKTKERKLAACALANKACPGAGRGWRASVGR